MKFSNRLYVAFAACVAFTLALGSLAVHEIGALTGHMREITGNWMPSVSTLLEIKSGMREFRTQELQHILSNDAREMDQWEAKMADTLRGVDEKMAIYGKLATTAEEKARLEQLGREQAARREAHMRLRELSRQNKTAEALALARGEVATLRNATTASIDALVAINEQGARTEVAMAEKAAGTARIAMPVAALLAALIGGVLAFRIVRVTMRQLGGDPEETREAVDRIASGDLVTPIVLRPGDRESLLASLAGMRERLAGVVSSIVVGSHEIRTASQEVAKGNLDLSSRTEQQSSSLQETASALEQITGTIRATSDNAGAANQLAVAASETAGRGGASVDALVRTMQEIADSSRSVQQIVGVIDGIAFQTNILALNAAVEAARAGESGRGFAVVASEVRTLAQRAGEAAREIKSLIDASATKVEAGTRIAGEAGATMAEVTQSVTRVTDIISEIASAAREQSTGVVQINEAVTQLDAVTQQNAALVEEAAAATNSMEEQAVRLVEAVSVFRIDADRSSSSVAASPARPGTRAPAVSVSRAGARPARSDPDRSAGSWNEF